MPERMQGPVCDVTLMGGPGPFIWETLSCRHVTCETIWYWDTMEDDCDE